MDTTALRSGASAGGTTSRVERTKLEPCPFHVVEASVGAPGAPLGDRVLACLTYGEGMHGAADPRQVPIGLPRLDVESGAELWISDEPVTVDTTDGIHHAHNSRVLFGWLRLSEADLANTERSVLRAYVRIDQLVNRLGFPHWLRAWNYLAHITSGSGDQERYRQFSLGRHHAVALKPGFERELPAATAIGTHTEGLTLCFVATRRPAIQVENPRQVSAFRYPREYGPRSPSFSRATLQHWQDRSVLLLSGTASVVGHVSLHPGDVALQFEETLANIHALLDSAAHLHLGSASRAGFQPEAFKVYLRSAADHEKVRASIREHLGAVAPVAVLQGDICRTDLLVEVEAVYSWRESDPPE